MESISKAMEHMNVDSAPTKADHCKLEKNISRIVHNAKLAKEEGNILFNAKEYKQAIGKYLKVIAYTRAVLPPSDKETQQFA